MGLKLIGEVALDGSGFERGLDRMADSVKGFIAGAFGLYGIEASIRKTADSAKELVNQSLRLGVGVEQLQVLKQAAKDGGKELDDMAKMFEKIDVARDKALSGSTEGMKLLARFAQLGISREDLLVQSASALTLGPIHQKALTTNQEESDPILRAFGKGLTELIPVLQTDFGALEKKMLSFGGIMGTETAAKLKSFNDGLDMLTNLFAVQFGPAMVQALESIEQGVSDFLGWMDERFRGKPPGVDTEPKESWASRAWGFSGKVGSGLIGGVTGLFGLWNELIGDTDKADERLMQAHGWFKQAGLEGGWLNEAADAMVDNMNKGGPSLKKAWDAIVEQRKKDVADLIERMKHPPEQKFEGADLPEEKAAKAAKPFREPSDALIRVGNFLGSSRDALETIAQRQVELLQRIAENTQPQSDVSGGGPSDNDFMF